jgi:hypothetical protein
LRDGSIPVSRRGGCAINKKIPFLLGADGVVSKFKQNKVRFADIYKEATRPFTNHPVCAAAERDLLIEAQPPLLEKEGNELASTNSQFPILHPREQAEFERSPRMRIEN